MNRRKRLALRGFTFLEIMVVVAILAILAGLIIPNFVGRAEDAKKTQASVQIREIMKALELYRLDNGSYPSTEQGLKALVEKPSGEPEPVKWKRYMDKVPLDPWKHEFVYICPGIDHRENPDDDEEEDENNVYVRFDLSSLGPDGTESDDDINSWNLSDN
ncbi:MAG: type II secretion system major pseudopilin GspG [bacterium]|nr:type II secretion system major pseudopilin GspG [bacterium]